jgi:hypothetical protein
MGYNATVFPQVTGMAATGNFTLIYEMARVMADEARALNNVAERAGVCGLGWGACAHVWTRPTTPLQVFRSWRQTPFFLLVCQAKCFLAAPVRVERRKRRPGVGAELGLEDGFANPSPMPLHSTPKAYFTGAPR